MESIGLVFIMISIVECALVVCMYQKQQQQ
jgi:hypothetical protein